MPHLTIATDDYGLGLYKDGLPWRYHKHGSDTAALLRDAVDEGFDSASITHLTDADRETDFC